MFEVADIKDDEVQVRTRDASRWLPLRNALITNPGKWLTVPAEQESDVRKQGKVSVQSFLDSKSGPGGTVEIGQVNKDGSKVTVIRYNVPEKPVAKKSE